MRRTALARRTPLKARKRINKQSAKAKINESLWQRIKLARCMFLMQKYGHVICEYCGRTAWGNDLGQLDAHHRDGNHKNSTEDNCYICHRICHDEIHRLRLKVKQLGFQGIKNVDNL